MAAFEKLNVTDESSTSDRFGPRLSQRGGQRTAGKSGTAVIHTLKMLDNLRTAVMRKLRCGAGRQKERQEWAELDVVGMLRVRNAAILDVVGLGSQQPIATAGTNVRFGPTSTVS